MKTKHTITDIEFHGNAHSGYLCYVADGEEVEVHGEFAIIDGVLHHEHWFDEEGNDTMEVLCDFRTYDVHFNDDYNSNSKGFEQSYDYCKGYIESWNGTDESYFEDYKGGIVSIVCNETGETVYEEEVR